MKNKYAIRLTGSTYGMPTAEPYHRDMPMDSYEDCERFLAKCKSLRFSGVLKREIVTL